MNIKQNSFFRLACADGKLITRSGETTNAKEILVKCLRGNYLKYNNQKYQNKDIKCSNNQRPYLNNTRREKFKRYSKEISQTSQ